MKNWKTTIVGVATIMVAVGMAAIAVLDNDPETVFNYTNLIAEITAGIALIKAADWESKK